jgi:hypothetical protein
MNFRRTTNIQNRGSQPRCLALTSGSRFEVANRLQQLAGDNAIVTENDLWMPSGRANPQEAKLGETDGFLAAADRDVITCWWLAVIPRANTPNWDIASTATVGELRGLILVEAKAHAGEFSVFGKELGSQDSSGSRANHDRIGKAISEVNRALEDVLPGWSLSRHAHYQLSNRFAWAWKCASLGYPVVLIFLGFLNATEMGDRGAAFRTAEAWERFMLQLTKGIVPKEAWGSRLRVGSTFILPLIKSISIPLPTIAWR